jgi:Zn-dependent protease with chaperone function
MRSLLILALIGYALAASAGGQQWLLRADWIGSAPRTAIAAWLALTFSVIMATLQAAVIVELPMIPLSLNPAVLRHCLAASMHLQFGSVTGAAAGAAAAVFLIVVIGRIAWCTTRTWSEARASRARHAQGLALIARPGPAPRSLILDDERPAVYCLPGLGRIVMTTGALNRLSSRQLDAVLGHEDAHLAGRHHIAVTFAAILAAALPGRLFTTASSEIARLIEMAADDAGSRTVSKVTLAEALFALAAARTPGDALSAGGSGVAQRIRRLIEPPSAATAGQRAAINATRGAAATAATLALTAAPAIAVVAGCCWAWP